MIIYFNYLCKVKIERDKRLNKYFYEYIMYNLFGF